MSKRLQRAGDKDITRGRKDGTIIVEDTPEPHIGRCPGQSFQVSLPVALHFFRANADFTRILGLPLGASDSNAFVHFQTHPGHSQATRVPCQFPI